MAGVAAWLVLQIAAARQWADPPYDWTTNYISDLGNTTCGPFTVPGGETTYVCSPAYELMNTGFIVSGALTTLGAILLWRYWPPVRVAQIAGGLWVLTGVGRVIVGLNPEDVDITMHMVGAMMQSASSIAVILAAIAIRKSSPALYGVGVTLGALGAIGAVLAIGAQLGITAFHLGVGPGLTERLASHPGQVWLVVVGIVVMVTTLRETRSRRAAAVA
jgi:hypothetical membrane protein